MKFYDIIDQHCSDLDKMSGRKSTGPPYKKLRSFVFTLWRLFRRLFRYLTPEITHIKVPLFHNFTSFMT